MKIIVEAPRKKNHIVQCTRCQFYGHTKSYCSRPYVCVKCGGEHNTTLCTKDPAAPATCALCGGQHPASYKGCIIHKNYSTHGVKLITQYTKPLFGHLLLQSISTMTYLSDYASSLCYLLQFLYGCIPVRYVV